MKDSTLLEELIKIEKLRKIQGVISIRKGEVSKIKKKSEKTEHST